MLDYKEIGLLLYLLDKEFFVAVQIERPKKPINEDPVMGNLATELKQKLQKLLKEQLG